jgi:YVTN family beta-propeller protein
MSKNVARITGRIELLPWPPGILDRTTMKHCHRLVSACLGAGFLAACSGGLNGFAGRASTPIVPLNAEPRSVPARLPSRPAAAGRNLYVANFGNNTVTVYLHGTTSVLRKITAGIKFPLALAFDGSGDLYVANLGCSLTCPPSTTSSVTVYAPGGTSVLRTISTGIKFPEALAFDSSDSLYVANSSTPRAVTVYAHGKRLARTISDGITSPVALAFDGSRNLYVANCGKICSGRGGNGKVTVYAPGSTSVLRTIHQGLSDPDGLLFDGSGDLYVKNSGVENVTVYAPGKNKVLRTISQDMHGPSGFAFDASGSLYVANNFSSTVTVYPPGGTSPVLTVSQGLNHPQTLAFSPYGDYFVGNGGNNTVTVYDVGRSDVRRTISHGVNDPVALGFGP